MIYNYFRVTGAHDTVLDYPDLFSITLRNDDVQEFDARWDGILLSMTKIPPDDALTSLDQLRIRESDQLKTVLELCEMGIHQKISRPDYQKLKMMVKRRKNLKTSISRIFTPDMTKLRQVCKDFLKGFCAKFALWVLASSRMSVL